MRVTLPDGTRPWIALPPGIPQEDRDAAEKSAAKVVQRARKRGSAAPERAAAHADGITASAWFDKWLDHREHALKLRSVRDDRGRVKNHILPIIGDVAMAGVTSDHIEDIRDELDRKIRASQISGSTGRNVWALVTRAFVDAKRSKDRSLRVRDDNPAADIEPPDKGEKRSKCYLYPSEFLALASATQVPLRWRRIFAIAVYSYARRGELEALEWPSVDLEHDLIHLHVAADRETGKVHSLKGKEARRVPIEKSLKPLLVAMRAEAGGKGRVFPVMPPAEDGAAYLRKCLRDYAGVDREELFANDETRKPLSFHDLRSTGLTWCAIRGDDPLRIQQRAGHKTFSTTQNYIREAENVGKGFGRVFPPLPKSLLAG